MRSSTRPTPKPTRSRRPRTPSPRRKRGRTSSRRALSGARAAAAPAFAEAVVAELQGLGLGEGEFRVELAPREPGASGADEIAFLIRPNPGLPFAPAAETASGGELSRIALALRAVAHAGGGEPTIVFDEIDAGIGGRTAHAVADALARLAERAQVVTITHLPQIASVADGHFRVEKVPGDPTHTRIVRLRRRGPEGRARTDAGRRGVPLQRARRMTFVEFTGTARLDRRTKRLVKRLGPGDIAIIDHTDLDRISAEELLESGVRVVVNVAQSTTGTYPNAGPLELVRGGVRLIDAPGAELFEDVREGESLVVRGAALFRNGTQADRRPRV